MAIDVTTGGGGSKIPRIDDGMYPARLYSVIELGTQKRDPFEGTPKDDCKQVIFTFEFPTKQVEIDGAMKPRILGKTYNIFTSENAALPKLIAALDPSGSLSGGGADAGKLVGVACMIQVGSTSGGKAKITNVSPLMEGLEVADGELEQLVFDYDYPDIEVFNKLPQWIQEKLTSSVGYKTSALAPLVASKPTEAPEVPPEDDVPY